MRGRAALAAVAAAALAAGVACGGGDGDAGGDGDDGDGAASGTTTTAPTTDPPGTAAPGTRARPLDEVELALEPVAEADAPTDLVANPATGTTLVAEREGRVRPLRDGALGDPVLDISDRVVTAAEQGLLGIEVAPDGSTLYVSYSLAPDGDTRVDAYALDGDAVEAGSHRELLAIEQPYPNHNGGDLAVGPDGYLYVGLGDGGGAGDPEGNGQDPHALLGSLLRIDPTRAEGDRPYGIPPDNPFADGRDGAPEVWLYGVRNPWRFTFDPVTGDLWVADVGQDAVEEIDLLPAADGAGRGANLGWDQVEGTRPYEGGSNPPGAVLPLLELHHDDGSCAVTGGVVHRGAGLPALDGAYLFTDYCDGRLRAVRVADGAVAEERTFDAAADELVAFGTDAAGEVYVLSLGGTIYRITEA
ncbi:MAG TPA: PQQ-dependent sugar dehydrogenase [Acidimicrobiales bacterium]|jgi:glucose/arabinose dehydrogenase|nr:PQQ-dependent sugar dehydrogenase [Acidimicrobiales bacterium]